MGWPHAASPQVDNSSKHAFKTLKIQLHEITTYNCHGSHDIRRTSDLLCMSLSPLLGPGQKRTLITPATPLVVPGNMTPSVNICGHVTVEHQWEIELINDSLTGTNVDARGKSNVLVASPLQAPAPLPEALAAAAHASAAAYGAYMGPGGAAGPAQPPMATMMAPAMAPPGPASGMMVGYPAAPSAPPKQV